MLLSIKISPLFIKFHGESPLTMRAQCVYYRYFPVLLRCPISSLPASGCVSYRPLPIAQVACSATGSAPIAPPLGNVTALQIPIYRTVWVREWNALRALAFLQNARENGFPRPLRRASLAQGPRNDKLGKLLVSKVNPPNLSLRNQSADWLWQSVFPAQTAR